MTVPPQVLTGALRAQARDADVRLRLRDGVVLGPVRIVERLIKQQTVDECTVAVRVSTGDVVHLGDVAAVLRGRP